MSLQIFDCLSLIQLAKQNWSVICINYFLLFYIFKHIWNIRARLRIKLAVPIANMRLEKNLFWERSATQGITTKKHFNSAGALSAVMFVLQKAFRNTSCTEGGSIAEFRAGISTWEATFRGAPALNSPWSPPRLLLATSPASKPAHPHKSLGSRAVNPSRGLTRVKNNTLFASLFLTQLSARIQLMMQLPQLGQGREQLWGAAGSSIPISVKQKVLFY